MRDDICTIPVTDAFEENDGCPICRMYDTVEKRILEYIMGAAMMEPDVRIETNRLGFCGRHYKRMLKMRGRLSLALILQTHAAEVRKNVTEAGFLVSKAKKADRAEELLESCFVCEKIEWGFERMLDTLYKTYETNRLSHYVMAYKTSPISILKIRIQLGDGSKDSEHISDCKFRYGIGILTSCVGDFNSIFFRCI